MTLVIALRWLMDNGGGVLVSSDSRATFGPITYEVRKIYPIYFIHNDVEIDLAIAGGAGDSAVVKQGYMIAKSILEDYSTHVGFRNLTFEEFSRAVQDIETKLIHRFSTLRKEGIEPDFEMILASVDPKGKVSMYLFDSRGLAEPVHDNPGFAIIGRGAATGGVLLTRLLGYSVEESPQLDLGMLSTFVIDIVSEVDPTVGPFVGESILMRAIDGKVVMGPLTTEALRNYKNRVGIRKDLIKLVQKLCDNEKIKEEKVKKALEELIPSQDYRKSIKQRKRKNILSN
jgi:hypothetical protein